MIPTLETIEILSLVESSLHFKVQRRVRSQNQFAVQLFSVKITLHMFCCTILFVWGNVGKPAIVKPLHLNRAKIIKTC